MDVVEIHEIINDENQITICEDCNGNGCFWSTLGFGEISGDERQIQCRLCNGTGRMRTLMVKAEIKVPFNHTTP